MKVIEAKAIAAVLKFHEQEAAAEAISLSTRQLRNILRREHVAAELNRQTRELINGTARKLASLMGDAADTLAAMHKGEVLASGPRASAARAIIEFALRATEIADLEERLIELERAGGLPRPAWRAET